MPINLNAPLETLDGHRVILRGEWLHREDGGPIRPYGLDTDGFTSGVAISPSCPRLGWDHVPPFIRNVGAKHERPAIPEQETAEASEPERLPFDPMQPVWLSDGTPVRLDFRDKSDGMWMVEFREESSLPHYAGQQAWASADGYVSRTHDLRLVNEPGASLAVRKAKGAYRNLADDLKPDFLSDDWFTPYAEIHFPELVERDEIAMVAFYENERKLEAGRRTEMRVGRYVRRFCGGKLKDEDVERVAAASDVKIRGNRVKITQDADEIEQVYVNGPNSCMSDDACEYDTDGIHPSRVYAGPDLGIAYIGELNDPSSRCVVWPEKKLYGRIYGDETRMCQMLEQLGYESGSMRGARVRLIECHYGIVMPYVDYISSAKIDRENGVAILGEGYDLECGNTNGLGGEDSRVTCDHCDERVNEDDTSRVEVAEDDYETWCDSCTNHDATYCSTYDWGQYVADDLVTTCYAANGEETPRPDWDLGDCVEVTAGDHAAEHWHVDATVEATDGETYHVDDALPEGVEPRVSLALIEAEGQQALPLPAAHQPGQIDVTKPLEAVHKATGRVVPMTYVETPDWLNALPHGGGFRTVDGPCPSTSNSLWYFDGRDYCSHDQWFIRNVVTADVPQASLAVAA